VIIRRKKIGLVNEGSVETQGKGVELIQLILKFQACVTEQNLLALSI